METLAKTATNFKEIFYEIGELSWKSTLNNFFFFASSTKFRYTLFLFWPEEGYHGNYGDIVCLYIFALFCLWTFN